MTKLSRGCSLHFGKMNKSSQLGLPTQFSESATLRQIAQKFYIAYGASLVQLSAIKKLYLPKVFQGHLTLAGPIPAAAHITTFSSYGISWGPETE